MEQRVLSHYRLEEKLGEGGMGVVYRAHDLNFSRDVVIKTLKPQPGHEHAARVLFLREAEAISQIDHPNVVDLIEVLPENDTMHLVMRYVDGPSLRELISNDEIDCRRALDIATDIASGLAAAHRCGVIHRDVKPENVLLTASGTPKLLDFGVAHFIGRTSVHQRGDLVGSFHSMAPEQVNGGEVDHRTDIYGLGVLLFEMIAHCHLFEREERAALLHDIVHREPPKLRERAPELPEGMEWIVHHALAKDPAERYQSMEEMARDLESLREALHEGEDTERRLISAPPPPWYLRRAILLIMILAVAGIGYQAGKQAGLWSWHQPAPPRVMVVPFDNSTGEVELAWLSQGIMDNLIVSLGEIEGCQIISRQTVGSAMDLMRTQSAGISDAVVFNLAGEVRARYLVSGSFARHDEGLRINCELSDIGERSLLSSWSSDAGDLAHDLLPILRGFAGEISKELGTADELAAEDGLPETEDSPLSLAAWREFEEGMQAFHRRDRRGAREHFEAAVLADSTLSRAYLYLAQCLPDHDESLRAMTQAMRYRHGIPQSERQLVEATYLETRGHSESAVEAYEQLLARDPEQSLARGLLAHLYLKQRRWSEAIAEFEGVRATNPFDFSFYPTLAYACLESGRKQQALDLLNHWHERFPELPQALMQLAMFSSYLGEYRRALELCDELEKVDPTFASPMRGPPLRFLGRLDEAEASFMQWGQGSTGEFRSSMPLILLAQLDHLRGDPMPGIERIQRALAMQDDSYARWVAGLLELDRGDLQAAALHAQAMAADIGDDLADTTKVEAYGARRWYFDLCGRVALAQGETERAVEMHRLAVRFSSRIDAFEYETGLADALLALGDSSSAGAALDRALVLNPHYGEALVRRAELALARGNMELARASCDEARSLWSEADEDHFARPRLEELQRRLDPH